MAHNLPYLFPSNGTPQRQQPAQHQSIPNTMPTSTPSAPPAMAQPQAQQAAFLQNAQLPGLDMARMLQGITPEQLAVIIQLYQAGQIPLPPVQTLQNAQVPAMAASPAVQPNGTISAMQPQEEEAMALDKEEGEWEEGEVPRQAGPDSLRPPPTSPRKRSGDVHARSGYNNTDKRTKRQPSPPRQPDGYDRRRPVGYGISSPPRSHARQRKSKHDAAKTFILAAYQAGFSFDDLAREIGDAKMLEVLFKELDLTVPRKPSPGRDERAAHVPRNNVTSVTGGSPLNVTNPTKASTAVKPVAKPVAAPKAPATADRSAYLAKLQAAKNKKHQDSLATSKADPVEAPTVINASTAQPQPPATTAAAVPTAVQQPKKANVQTDLIRKRLEALKEEQARKREAERVANAAAANNSAAIPSLPEAYSNAQTPSISMSVTPQHSTPVPQAAAPAPALDFASQFPGLPGLFMTGTPTQAPVAASRPEPPAPLQPAPKPAPIDTTTKTSPLDQPSSADISSPEEKGTTIFSRETSIPGKALVASSGQATPKYPFNQSNHDSNDDSVIINVSDEEESELDDDMEDEEEAPSASVPASKSTMPTTVKPGPLRNFPAPYSASTSVPGTPGATTPGGTAYERKMQEISEMHRRIAEMQKQPKKVKAKVAPEPAAAQPVTLPQNAPALPGLSSHATVAFPQPNEQHPAETSQQMEVKLAQLQQEADIISEQRNSSQADQLTTQQGVPSAPETGVPATSSDDNDSDDLDDDDDDAMDLSSGDDSDSDEDMPQIETQEPAASEGQAEDTDPLTRVDTASSAQMEIDSSSSDESDDTSKESEEDKSDGDYEPAPAAPNVPADSGALAQSAPLPITGLPSGSPTLSQQNEVDLQDADLAPELQPSTDEQHIISAIPETNSTRHYKPYESPLRMFKDYRFHPQYTSDVPGGFTSLTYSNKIDPTEAMCPDELSNGTCEDPKCTHQHFRNTAFAGPDLLKDLGTRNPPCNTKEDLARWRTGLAEVIRHLRDTNQAGDVDVVAARIAQFRREFIGAHDKVLNLKT